MTLQANTIPASRQAADHALITDDVLPQRTISRRTPLYLVGEQDRSAAKPTGTPQRSTVCINGQWHTMRSDVATFEQIVGLTITVNPGQTVTALSVTYRRGVASRPAGSLNPGDVVPIVDGMLFNANATILS